LSYTIVSILFNSVGLNPRLYSSFTGLSQNFAAFRSRETCTWLGSPRSLEKKKNRYGPLWRTVGLTLRILPAFQPGRYATARRRRWNSFSRIAAWLVSRATRGMPMPKIKDIKVIESSSRVFDAAVIDALRRTEFEAGVQESNCRYAVDFSAARRGAP